MYFEDIPLGGKITLGSFNFTEENIIAFARQFDPQPFHLDADAAVNGPYGGLIASGWHTAAVWMKLMVANRRASEAMDGDVSQENYLSPGTREMRWHLPVRPGLTLTYTTEAFNKRDWPSQPRLGLLQSRNEARGPDEKLYYSFISQVFIIRKPK
jgi:acyl dehydratase